MRITKFPKQGSSQSPGPVGTLSFGGAAGCRWMVDPEDLTSPAHTRNDPHPVDPFERYNNRRTPATPTGALLSFSSADAYLTALQAHTQANFFSDDTVFDPALPGPAATAEDNQYFYDAAGRAIAYKGYWRQGCPRRSCGHSSSNWLRAIVSLMAAFLRLQLADGLSCTRGRLAWNTDRR